MERQVLKGGSRDFQEIRAEGEVGGMPLKGTGSQSASSNGLLVEGGRRVRETRDSLPAPRTTTPLNQEEGSIRGV